MRCGERLTGGEREGVFELGGRRNTVLELPLPIVPFRVARGGPGGEVTLIARFWEHSVCRILSTSRLTLPRIAVPSVIERQLLARGNIPQRRESNQAFFGPYLPIQISGAGMA